MSPELTPSRLGDETADLLQDLIRQACVNDGTVGSGQEIRNVGVLERYFEGSAISYEVIEPEPGRGNLVARIPGSNPDAPSVTLVGHLDVVPAADAELWQQDPFGGARIDDPEWGPMIWGRGAIDMLGLTAAFSVVCKEIAERDTPLQGDLILAAVADEEAGGRFGAGWLAANRPELITADYALTENGGIVLGNGITLTTGEKGGAPRTLKVTGRSGHGSVPWRSKNAAAIAADAVHRIATSPGEPLLLGHWLAFVAASDFAPDLKLRLVDPATVNDAIDELGPMAAYAHALTHMTVAPTRLQSGVKSNVLPGSAEIGLDIRLLPGQGATDVDRYLKETLGELLADIEVVEVLTGAASASEPVTPFSAAIERAFGRHYPDTHLVPMVAPGGTDGRFLRQLGAVTYGFGLFSPGWDVATFRALFHGRDERVDLESLRLTTESLHESLVTFLD